MCVIALTLTHMRKMSDSEDERPRRQKKRAYWLEETVDPRDVRAAQMKKAFESKRRARDESENEDDEEEEERDESPAASGSEEGGEDEDEEVTGASSDDDDDDDDEPRRRVDETDDEATETDEDDEFDEATWDNELRRMMQDYKGGVFTHAEIDERVEMVKELLADSSLFASVYSAAYGPGDMGRVGAVSRDVIGFISKELQPAANARVGKHPERWRDLGRWIGCAAKKPDGKASHVMCVFYKYGCEGASEVGDCGYYESGKASNADLRLFGEWRGGEYSAEQTVLKSHVYSLCGGCSTQRFSGCRERKISTVEYTKTCVLCFGGLKHGGVLCTKCHDAVGKGGAGAEVALERTLKCLKHVVKMDREFEMEPNSPAGPNGKYKIDLLCTGKTAGVNFAVIIEKDEYQHKDRKAKQERRKDKHQIAHVIRGLKHDFKENWRVFVFRFNVHPYKERKGETRSAYDHMYERYVILRRWIVLMLHNINSFRKFTMSYLFYDYNAEVTWPAYSGTYRLFHAPKTHNDWEAMAVPMEVKYRGLKRVNEMAMSRENVIYSRLLRNWQLHVGSQPLPEDLDDLVNA